MPWWTTKLYSSLNSSELRQFFPVVQLFQCTVPDLGDKLSLDSLQPVDRGLVSRWPQLAEIVQPWLEKTPYYGKHNIFSSSPKGAQGPARHSAARMCSHVYLDAEGEVSTDPDTQVSPEVLLLNRASIWWQIECEGQPPYLARSTEVQTNQHWT